MNTYPRSALFDLDGFFSTPRYHQVSNKSSANTFNPRVDILDNDDSYQLIAELPGFSKENIVVTIDDATLLIEANNTNESQEEESGKFLRRERQYGKFTRSFTLGENIDQSDIKASFKNGLLYLTVPKAQQADNKPLTIDIH